MRQENIAEELEDKEIESESETILLWEDKIIFSVS